MWHDGIVKKILMAKRLADEIYLEIYNSRWKLCNHKLLQSILHCTDICRTHRFHVRVQSKELRCSGHRRSCHIHRTGLRWSAKIKNTNSGISSLTVVTLQHLKASGLLTIAKRMFFGFFLFIWNLFNSVHLTQYHWNHAMNNTSCLLATFLTQ